MRGRSGGARTLLFVLAAAQAAAGAAGAEVLDRSASGFTVRTSVAVAAPADRIYRELLNVGAWWDKEHTYSGDARNLSVHAEPGACFCEKMPGGGAVEHGRVVNVNPGRLLRLSAALGPLQELATTGTLTWAIEPQTDSRATVTVTYAVGGYAPGGLDKLADIVDFVLNRQVTLLKAHAESAR